MVKLSIVIPIYNEEDSIRPLYNALRTVLNPLNILYEIIFINDGSTDSTTEILEKLKTKNSYIKIIIFKRNLGKADALMAGFKKAKGDIIITMDGDLQDDPKEIPKFINVINSGFDLVSGWKFKRHDPLMKTIPSKMFNSLTRIVTGIKIHDSNCGFKAYKKEVVQKLHIYGELHRYIPSLVHWMGYTIGEMKVEHHTRKFGKSKYTTSRLISGFLDLITIKYLNAFKKKPLHFFGIIGIFFSLAGLILSCYLIYLKYSLGLAIGRMPLLFLATLLIIMSIQFFSIGLLGEMITSEMKK